MPLRDLIYVVKEYQGMVSNRSLYSSRPVKLPTPSFVVFYNGTPHQPERKLMQYSQYVSKVQEYVLVMSLEEAVQRAVDECIREGILADFLLKNRAEAIAVSIFEYDEERELALLRREERKEGREEGLKQGIKVFILNNLEEGTSEERILKKLMKRFAMTEDVAKEYLKKYQME